MNISKEKNCLICDVPTSCLHYGKMQKFSFKIKNLDVFSCRGCKQFFRRSYLFAKQYKCKFKNDCNLKKGAKCKACRYKKCIAVGMNPEAIISNETTAIQVMCIWGSFRYYMIKIFGFFDPLDDPLPRGSPQFSQQLCMSTSTVP